MRISLLFMMAATVSGKKETYSLSMYSLLEVRHTLYTNGVTTPCGRVSAENELVEVSMPQFTSCDTCISYMYRQAKVVYVLYVITRTAKLQYD